MFDIKGHSGCKIELLHNHDKYIVRKTSKSLSYNIRLENQVKKQKKFFNSNQNCLITTPKVLNNAHSGDLFYFDMVFFRSYDTLSFLQICQINDVHFYLETLIEFIENEIKNSKMVNFNKNLFYKKFLDVKTVIDKKLPIKLLNKIDKIFLSLDEKILMPIGVCHGDLTFSNILVSRQDKKLVIFDFLDCFIESPLQDIIKIRQDTCFYWSIQLYKNKIDKMKLKIILDSFDSRMHFYFNKYTFYKVLYKPFQIMNFLRILQYTDDKNTIFFIKKIIFNLVNNKI
jgi:hypothetical protein